MGLLIAVLAGNAAATRPGVTRSTTNRIAPKVGSDVSGHPAFGHEYDWIEVSSGEWLKGRIRWMVGEKLTFRSVSTGVQILPIHAVQRMETHRLMRFLLDDQKVIVGRMTFADGDFSVVQGQSTRRVPADAVAVMTPVPVNELQNWEAKVSLGIQYQQGNNPEFTVNAAANITRQSVDTRLHLGYIGNYSRNFDQLTVSDQLAWTSFDYFINHVFFIRTVRAYYYYAPFRNLALDLTVGPGLGVQFFRRPNLSWDGVVGPAYEYIAFESVPVGQSDTVSSPAAVITSAFMAMPLPHVKTSVQFELEIMNKRAGLVNLDLVGKVGYGITKELGVEVSVLWDRIEVPTSERDGDVPRKDDLTVTTSVTVDW